VRPAGSTSSPLSVEQRFLAVILTIRVWAVWGRDRRLTIGLPIFFAVCFAPCIALIEIFLKSSIRESTLLAHSFTFSHFSLIAIPVQFSQFGTCLYSARGILYINWSLLMVYDLGVLCSYHIRMTADIHHREQIGTCTLMIIAAIRSCKPHSFHRKSHTLNGLDGRQTRRKHCPLPCRVPRR
jgi:hypothetical protein